MADMRKKTNLVLAIINTLTATIWLVNALIDVAQGAAASACARNFLLTLIWAACACGWWLRWKHEAA